MRFLIYSKMSPFPGYIKHSGFFNPDQKPDGSTVYEHIQKVLADNPNLALALDVPPVEQGKKYDPAAKSLVDLGPEDITPEIQKASFEEEKQITILQNMPSLKTVQDAIDKIATLSDAKVFLKKLSAVVYYLSQNAGGG